MCWSTSSQAMFNLAVAYSRGDGVEVDLREASKWYRRAAALGHTMATRSGELRAMPLGPVQPGLHVPCPSPPIIIHYVKLRIINFHISLTRHLLNLMKSHEISLSILGGPSG